MLNMSIKFLLALLLPINVSATDLECDTSQIRALVFGRTETSTATFCTNEMRTNLFSKNCQKNHCAALAAASRRIDISQLNTEVGKPGFKLCRLLGGKPELIEFLFRNTWYRLDRCLFDSDQSFVDTGTLLENSER